MPRPALPPTPGSSTSLDGQDGSQRLASLNFTFELPPPAYNDRKSPTSPLTLSPTSTAPSYTPQAAEAVKARRRSLATSQQSKESRSSHDGGGGSGDAFTLPPPPTRSRKIIQMKPGPSQTELSETPAQANVSTVKGKTATGKSGKGAVAGQTGDSKSKKKQPSATSAAGRKIARKTAHSLIERRRRSKMNEEFALLKSLIPACTHEMHKLAILQASIEYLQYLESCVSTLKTQISEANTEGAGQISLPSIHEFHPTFRDATDNDVNMSDGQETSSEYHPHGTPHLGPDQHAPAQFATSSTSRQPSISPALLPQDTRHRTPSNATAASDQRHYSFSGSVSETGYVQAAYDQDQEATAALLMLTKDRRGRSQPGRGLSVRDLLAQ